MVEDREREEIEEYLALQTEWEDAQSDIPFGMSFREWVESQGNQETD